MIKLENGKPLYDENHDLIGFSYNSGEVIHHLTTDILFLPIGYYIELIKQVDLFDNILTYINQTFNYQFKNIQFIEILFLSNFVVEKTEYKHRKDRIEYFVLESSLIATYYKKTKTFALKRELNFSFSKYIFDYPIIYTIFVESLKIALSDRLNLEIDNLHVTF